MKGTTSTKLEQKRQKSLENGEDAETALALLEKEDDEEWVPTLQPLFPRVRVCSTPIQASCVQGLSPPSNMIFDKRLCILF